MGEAQLDGRVVQQLYQKAGAGRWGLSIDRFRLALEAGVAKGGESGALHLEDLALAAACADGNEGAWEHFVREHRPVLYRAADAIDRTGAAREAADSLYAELFGLTERDGERRSLFRYFHGRSSLATWLRAVLAQRYVDNLRRTRRPDTLPADDDPGAIAAAPAARREPDRTRHVVLIQAAITVAISRLPPRDRLRLACYYAQDLTLAQIGRTLGEHEATTSRHLARTQADDSPGRRAAARARRDERGGDRALFLVGRRGRRAAGSCRDPRRRAQEFTRGSFYVRAS